MRIALSGKLTLILTRWPLLWNTGQFFQIVLKLTLLKYIQFIVFICCGDPSWRNQIYILWISLTFVVITQVSFLFEFNNLFSILWLLCIRSNHYFFHNAGFRCETRVSFFIILKDCPTKTAFSIRFYYTTLF